MRIENFWDYIPPDEAGDTGLGRYYGLHGDKNSLSVPFDILESLSKHYNIEVADLYSAYAKGLYHGIEESESERIKKPGDKA